MEKQLTLRTVTEVHMRNVGVNNWIQLRQSKEIFLKDIAGNMYIQVGIIIKEKNYTRINIVPLRLIKVLIHFHFRQWFLALNYREIDYLNDICLKKWPKLN